MNDNKLRAEKFADILNHEEYYGSDNKTQVFFNRLRIKHIVGICGDLSCARVLDVGIGEGFMAEQLHAQELWGIDISEKRCEKAKKRLPRTHIILGDGHELAFKNNFFDVVVCADVLEHTDKPERAIREMMRVLRVGGSAIVSVPNETMLIIARALTLQKNLKNPDHLHNISPGFLIQHFGREPIRSFNIPAFPYPLCIWQCYKFIK